MSDCHSPGSSTLPVLLHLYAVKLKGGVGCRQEGQYWEYWAGRTVMWLLCVSCLLPGFQHHPLPRNNWLLWAGSKVVLASGALLGHTFKKKKKGGGGAPIPTSAVKLCLFHSTRTGTVGRGSSADLNPTLRSVPQHQAQTDCSWLLKRQVGRVKQPCPLMSPQGQPIPALSFQRPHPASIASCLVQAIPFAPC